jgi:hypothetical protein
MKKILLVLGFVFLFVIVYSHDRKTIMEKMKENIPLVMFGDYTGTFNGIIGNITPGSGIFTTLIVGQPSQANLYLGSLVGNSNTGTAYNTIVGTSSAQSISGDGITNGRWNTGVGFATLGYLTTGSCNTALGDEALTGLTTNVHCIGIGIGVGQYETGDGRLIIDGYGRSSLTDSRTHSLIYGVMSQTGSGQSLTINGQLILPSGFSLGGTTITATGNELNYTSGVTSSIQPQLNAKAPISSPSFTNQMTISGLKWGYQTLSSGTLTLNATDAVLVLCANNGNAKTLKLPASPTTASMFWIINDGTVGMTVDGNGKNIINAGASNSSLTLGAAKTISVIYTGRVWYITEDHIY